MYTLDTTPISVLFVAVLLAAVVGLVTMLALGADFLSRNRNVRLSQRLSIPTYYRTLATGH